MDCVSEFFYLVGPPAVGKLTIASELARRADAIVVDNHLISDPVFVPMGVHRGEPIEQTDQLRARILDVVLEATVAAHPRFSHVFTHWLTDAPDNAALVERLRGVAAQRGAKFVPVWLIADHDELLSRVGNHDRAKRAKLLDPLILRQLLDRPLLPPPDDALQLDVTTLSPQRAVDRILDSLG